MSFRLIPPLAIGDATLLASSVPEAPPAAHSMLATYAQGVLVSVFDGPGNSRATVYASLQNGNTGNTPASSPLWWREAGVAYLAWEAATNWPVDAIVTRAHRLWLSLQGGNAAHVPESSPDWWRDLGPSNRWAPFDTVTATRSEWFGAASWTLQPPGRVDTVALMSLAAAEATVLVEKDGEEVFSRTVALTSTAGIANAYAYCFEPIVRRRDLVLTGLPKVWQPTITITLSDSLGTVALGHVVVGLARRLGGTQFGASLGVTDYSRKERDPNFGHYTWVERDYTKRAAYRVWIDNAPSYLDSVYNLLAEYRARPVLVIGSDTYAAAAAFCRIEDWDVTVERARQSLLTIRTDGI